MDFFDILLARKLSGGSGGGGSSVSVQPLEVYENGVYRAPSGKAYSPVYVDIFPLKKGRITISIMNNTSGKISFWYVEYNSENQCYINKRQDILRSQSGYLEPYAIDYGLEQGFRYDFGSTFPNIDLYNVTVTSAENCTLNNGNWIIITDPDQEAWLGITVSEDYS